MRKAKRKPFAKAQRSLEGKTQRYEKVALQGFHLSSVSLKAFLLDCEKSLIFFAKLLHAKAKHASCDKRGNRAG